MPDAAAAALAPPTSLPFTPPAWLRGYSATKTFKGEKVILSCPTRYRKKKKEAQEFEFGRIGRETEIEIER